MEDYPLVGDEMEEVAPEIIDSGPQMTEGFEPELDENLEPVQEVQEPADSISTADKEDELDPEVVKALKDTGDKAIDMDKSVREIRMAFYKKLINYFDGDQLVYWDEEFGNWRPIGLAQDLIEESEDIDLDDYAKVANVFKASIISIIAALTAAPPKVKYIPDDADNPLDIDTAKQYQLIQRKIEKQRETRPDDLVTRILKIKYTQGLPFAYVYPMESPALGFYNEPITAVQPVPVFTLSCPNCGNVVQSGEVNEQLTGLPEEGKCPVCQYTGELVVNLSQEEKEVTTGYSTHPKHKICIDLYGPLNVYIPFFVTSLKQVPILELSTEMHYAEAMEKFGLTVRPESNEDEYGKLLRSPQNYSPDYNDIVTVKQRWYRHWAFNMLENPEHIAQMKAKYPEGCYAVFIEDNLVEIYEENLDERWTCLVDPLSEFLHAQPEGKDLIDLQDLINEMLNLTVDTIEHGIPETYANPQVVSFEGLKSRRNRPGNITAARPRPGMTLQNDIVMSQSSSLSQEHNNFASRLLELSQLISGAQPTIYGGALKGGSNTAREYESSRAMSLQRLSILWKMIKSFYANIMGLAVPLHVSLMRDDEKFVEELQEGNFINVLIEKKKLTGKIGEITYDTAEQLPTSWAEERDILRELIALNNPVVGEILLNPNNSTMVASRLGISNMYIPGDEDRTKQLSEIAELIKGQPQPNQMLMQMQQDPLAQAAMQAGQMPPVPPMISSVPVDPDLDNHMIEAETCASWLKSSTGRAFKIINPSGYENVKLHFMEHKFLAAQQMQQMAQPEQEEQGNVEE